MGSAAVLECFGYEAGAYEMVQGTGQRSDHFGACCVCGLPVVALDDFISTTQKASLIDACARQTLPLSVSG